MKEGGPCAAPPGAQGPRALRRSDTERGERPGEWPNPINSGRSPLVAPARLVTGRSPVGDRSGTDLPATDGTAGRPPARIPSFCDGRRETSRSTNSSGRSGPSSPGSVITFDPDRLEKRARRARAGDGRLPGSGTTSSTPRQISTEHARVTKPARALPPARAGVRGRRRSWSAMDGEMADEIAARIAPLRARARPAARRTRSSTASTTRATRSSRSTPERAAPTRRTGRRSSCACTCAGPSSAASRRELIEASPGEEAGLKSATFTVRGENAYGIFKAERGVHRLVRLSPFDQAHRRHTSFAQVIVSPLLADDAGVEIDEADLRDRHVPGERRRRPAREQDRLGRPDHPPPHRHRRPVPERALADLEQADRTAHPPLAARRARGRSSGRRSWRRSEAPCRRPTSGVKSAAMCSTRTSSSRTTGPSHEVGNAQGVLDGDLDGFVHAYLLAKAAGKVRSQPWTRVDCPNPRPVRPR